MSFPQTFQNKNKKGKKKKKKPNKILAKDINFKNKTQIIEKTWAQYFISFR